LVDGKYQTAASILKDPSQFGAYRLRMKIAAPSFGHSGQPPVKVRAEILVVCWQELL
jgi:hypothetical protein